MTQLTYDTLLFVWYKNMYDLTAMMPKHVQYMYQLIFVLIVI